MRSELLLTIIYILFSDILFSDFILIVLPLPCLVYDHVHSWTLQQLFFAAHLLDIAMGFKTLRTILSSVTHNGKQVKIYLFFPLQKLKN